MKKILLTLVTTASFAYLSKLNAQCNVDSIAVHLNSTTSINGNCVVNIDLSFDLEHNSGNKYIYIHLWRAIDYPPQTTTFGNQLNTSPDAAKLAATITNLGINNNISGSHPVSTYLVTYAPDNSVVLQVPPGNPTVTTTGSSSVGYTDHFTISGLNLLFPGGCGGTLAIIGDVWSTNSASSNSVQCLAPKISFFANDPTVTGFKTCTSPRHLNLGIQTQSTTNIDVSYTLYKDDGDGVFEPGGDDSQVGSGGPFTINSSNPYSNTNVSYTGNDAVGENSDIWVAVTNSASSNLTISLFLNACSPLPISLKSFTAVRNHSNVNVAWITSSEQNNMGFQVQRQIGTGSWQRVAFIPSQALAGNSNADLTYTYVDPNPVKAISNYRIMQVDLDGQTKYSNIRSVRGEGQLGRIIVFPNPSFDGKVRVVFDEVNSLRNIILLDMSGRALKQWKDFSNNNLEIDNLTPGFYSLRIVNNETGEQSIEKIVVNKR